MSNRTPSIIAGLLTFFILVAFAILSVFGQMVVLNGASERQAFNAMGISVICQSVVLLLAVILARWLSNQLITKFNWNKVLAVVITVVVARGFGGLISLLSIIIAIPLIGIR